MSLESVELRPVQSKCDRIDRIIHLQRSQAVLTAVEEALTGTNVAEVTVEPKEGEVFPPLKVSIPKSYNLDPETVFEAADTIHHRIDATAQKALDAYARRVKTVERIRKVRGFVQTKFDELKKPLDEEYEQIRKDFKDSQNITFSDEVQGLLDQAARRKAYGRLDAVSQKFEEPLSYGMNEVHDEYPQEATLDDGTKITGDIAVFFHRIRSGSVDFSSLTRAEKQYVVNLHHLLSAESKGYAVKVVREKTEDGEITTVKIISRKSEEFVLPVGEPSEEKVKQNGHDGSTLPSALAENADDVKKTRNTRSPEFRKEASETTRQLMMQDGGCTVREAAERIFETENPSPANIVYVTQLIEAVSSSISPSEEVIIGERIQARKGKNPRTFSIRQAGSTAEPEVSDTRQTAPANAF